MRSAIRLASFGDNPTSRAVSSRDGAGPVIITLRGMVVQYVAGIAGVNPPIGHGDRAPAEAIHAGARL